MKDIRRLYGPKIKKGINDKVSTDIRTLYESNEKDYYKPIRIVNAFSSYYIQYELSMAISFISSKDSNETSIMHVKSDNIEIIIGNQRDAMITKINERK